MTFISTSKLLLALAVAGLASAHAQAGVVTSVPLNVATTTITFDGYAGANAVTIAQGGSENVGAAEGLLESVHLFGNGSDDLPVLSDATTLLGGNGQWPTQGAYAGLNNATGTMVFRFERGLNFVGGLLNYLPSSDSSSSIAALDFNGDIIGLLDGLPETDPESEELQFSFGPNPPAGQAQFMGFFRPTADIWGFALTGNFVVVDNLTFGNIANVPEPNAVLLVGAALLALGWQRRQARAQRR